MFAVTLNRSLGDACERATLKGPAARTTLSDVLPPACLQVAGERQPSLPLRDTRTRSGEEATEQYPGRAGQYADQPGAHWRPARRGAELLDAAGGPPPQSNCGSSPQKRARARGTLRTVRSLRAPLMLGASLESVRDFKD